MPAHQPGLASGGQVTDRYIAYQRARARSGVSMQVTGATPVAPSAQWNDICLWNVDDSIIEGYQKLGRAVREEGSRMLAQLTHPGPTEYSGPKVWGPSRDFSEVTHQVVVEATPEQIEDVVREYAAAARRCREGELDGVEISGAHGNWVAAFLSPLTNRRDDEFGGDFDRRLEVTIRILDAVRAEIGHDRMLGLRLGIDDLNPGGILPPEAAKIAQALEDRVDYFSVMVGNNNRYESRVRHWPPTPAEPGIFRGAAHVITEAVNKPVAAVGRVLTLELANDMINAGDADFVGMVRAQIADAKLISLSKAGREKDVRPCIGINVCSNNLLAGKTLSCAVNPDAASSEDPAEMSRLDGLNAVVVGSGPAGLESARRLAVRGAQVTLFEGGDTLGGRLAQWSQAPSRHEVYDYVEWQKRQLAEFGVDVRLNTLADARAVLECEPAEIVLATGAPDIELSVPNDGSIQTLTADDVFAATLSGTRAVVYDIPGAVDSLFIAEYLVKQGFEVTLVTSRIHVAEGEGVNSFYPMLRTIADLGVTIIERSRLREISNGVASFEGIFGEAGHDLPADLLVSWSGGDPDLTLAHELDQLEVSYALIGDALRPRRFLDATNEAKLVTDPISA